MKNTYYNFARSQQDLKSDQFIFGLQPRYRVNMLGDGLLTKGDFACKKQFSY